MLSENDYSQLSDSELRKLLAQIEEEKQEIELERRLTFGGSVHIGAKEGERLRNTFERDLRRAEEKKAKAEEELRRRGL
ncbi:MAG: hypothetical protein HY776_06880 [Actinobacteria bacterium]|nr:hypothetical protein [Actinomycetota bacterium]